MIWLLSLILIMMLLAYHREPLWATVIAHSVWASVLTYFVALNFLALGLIWILLVGLPLFFLITPLRRRLISEPILLLMHRFVPSMSSTERIALETGTVGWEGNFFTGKPQWKQLLAYPKLNLTVAEQAFMDGPVAELCRLINDWQISQTLKDLPNEVWVYLKEKGFFGIEIPNQYGGLGFSAFAHSQILLRLASRSLTVASTVAVPNSLGPAELILHYGTSEQKDYYLPRLARGEEVPCFALTGIAAGSDATAMTDTGVVCHGNYQGKEVLGIRLNANKRYITLAPIATVIGLAFKLYDPDHLLSEKTARGITCALVPRNTKGVKIGQRHYPMYVPFQNGPIQIQDAFIPLTALIGGASMIGEGWRMLVECLAVGRAISLPANALAGAKLAVSTSGAYARIRKQFKLPIAQFEGIQATLSRMACHAALIDAGRRLAIAAIQQGEQPSVPSAIVKYHATERGRQAMLDAMDVHGGKGICLGPHNYLAQAYVGQPIGITVEGANILTRNLIIYGQGAVRCHPYLLTILQANANKHSNKHLKQFDQALFAWFGQIGSEKVRAFYLGLTNGYGAFLFPSRAKRYYQKFNRYAAAFSFVSDNCLVLMNSQLKRKELLSARLGDVLSDLYLGTALLKQYYDEGEPSESFALIEACCQQLVYRIESALDAILSNFPYRGYARCLRFIVFPLGRWARIPQDTTTRQVAKLMSSASELRDRMLADLDYQSEDNNPLFLLQKTFNHVLQVEALERRVAHAMKNTANESLPWSDQIARARADDLINEQECQQLLHAEQLRTEVLGVDAFDGL